MRRPAWTLALVMAPRLGRLLIALSVASVAFAAVKLLCGVVHAELGVHAAWVHTTPRGAPVWWLTAQALILLVWPCFLYALPRTQKPDVDFGPYLIVWPALAFVSILLACMSLDSGTCGCPMHDPGNDLLIVVAAAILPLWRIALVRGMLAQAQPPLPPLRARRVTPAAA
jgi:hypothetical protein